MVVAGAGADVDSVTSTDVNVNVNSKDSTTSGVGASLVAGTVFGFRGVADADASWATPAM